MLCFRVSVESLFKVSSGVGPTMQSCAWIGFIHGLEWIGSVAQKSFLNSGHLFLLQFRCGVYRDRILDHHWLCGHSWLEFILTGSLIAWLNTYRMCFFRAYREVYFEAEYYVHYNFRVMHLFAELDMDWIGYGSKSCLLSWIGLDGILKNGPMNNSGPKYNQRNRITKCEKFFKQL